MAGELPVLPQAVEQIIKKLEEAGYEAYAVGGCVRDALLSRRPEDWDITTSALPEQVKKLFERTVDTGIAHGTVTVLLQGTGYEVTTYRIDGEYRDSRHPESVAFTPDLREDLKRRDFTINAMAYNPEKGLVDLFGGRRDLEAGIVRCVGNPVERFTEDALRILRAVRFSAQLGFEIEEETKRAMKALAPNLKNISQERIQAELNKLLLSGHPEKLAEAAEMGITAVALPEWDALIGLPQRNPWHCMDAAEHSLEAARQIKSDKVLRWAAILHDIGKPAVHSVTDGCDCYEGHAEKGAEMAKEILRRLKFDNDTIAKVSKLTRYHAYHFRQRKSSVRRAMSLVGEDLFPGLLELMRADTMAKSELAMEKYLPAIRELENLHRQILEDGECFCLPMLEVKGNHLKAAGIQPGPEIGKLLAQMLSWVLERPEENEKKWLIQHFTGEITVRIFQPEDAERLSALIREDLLEANGKDDPPGEQLAARYSRKYICWLAEEGRMYVACRGEEILGCGAVIPEEGKQLICAVFAAKNARGQGIEERLAEALETDPMAEELGGGWEMKKEAFQNL